MNRKCDMLIIGAGILGCFAARSLSRYALDITVLEKRGDVCCGISRANTGIIYQGYDQHPGSLKAKLCRKASLSFPSLCKELDIHYRRSGLLMLSFGPEADQVLKHKIEQGNKNGINDIRLIDSRQVYEMEPALCSGISGALYSQNTYTVNPWEMGIAAFENAAANHVNFRFNEEVLHIHRTETGFAVQTQNSTYTASRLLCCAGLSSDSLWEMVSKPKIKIMPLAADYLIFDKSAGSLIDHVISVEPEKKGDGITLVPTPDGNILAGPTRRKISGLPDNSTDITGILELKEKCRHLLPSLSPDLVIRSFGSVRPNPFLTEADGSISGKSLNDFIILEEAGLFAMIGIKTPGITCAAELGDYIAQQIISSMSRPPEPNPSFCPKRKGIPRIRELLSEGSSELTRLPEEYFEIICRCEQISKGEILEAIRRGAVSVDGVKRRTRAGMGRCQGGYCMEKVLHILNSCTGKDVYEITKDGPGSEIITKA